MLRVVLVICLAASSQLIADEVAADQAVSLPPKITDLIAKISLVEKDARMGEVTQQLGLGGAADRRRNLPAKGGATAEGKFKLWLLWDLEVDGEWVLETIFVDLKIQEISIRKGSVLYWDTGKGFDRPRIFPYWKSGTMLTVFQQPHTLPKDEEANKTQQDKPR
jgi:hypothetical protein